MNYSYSYTDPFGNLFSTVFGAVFGIGILIGAAMNIAAYVMQSYGIYTIAKRRGLNHPWLAWLPIGCEWLVGSVSDQYQYVVREQVKSRRKVMLVSSVICHILQVAIVVLAVFLASKILSAADSIQAGLIVTSLLGEFASLLFALITMLVVYITLLVFWYMSLYDLFCSCDPGNATACLILSIAGCVLRAFASFFVLIEPIFLLVVCRKDKGMPPRRDVQPQPAEDVPMIGEVPQPVTRDPWEE